jgi:hypothetical protein
MYLRFDVKLIAGAISPGKFLSEFPDWDSVIAWVVITHMPEES